jgi:hypothetical protein
VSISRRASAALAALALLAAFSHAGLRRSYALPWPGLGRLVLGPDALQDVSFTAAGFRRAAADVAWIQFLHAIAVDMHAHEEEDEHEHGHDGDHPEAEGPTAGVRDAALRVARIDPYFIQAYLFGAGVLAFDYSDPRPAEALELLREGIERNPGDRSLQTVTAAILYKVRGQSGPMLEELEKLAAEPDCPGLMRAILANLYKREGLTAKAAAMWRLVLEGRSSSGERDRAAKELAELSATLDGRH